MTAPLLATRDALVDVAGRHAPVCDHDGTNFRLLCGCGDFEHWGTDRSQAEQRFGEHVADALLASGVVRDPATLADDEALVERTNALPPDAAGDWPQTLFAGRVPEEIRDVLRALAAALTESTEER